MIWVKLFEEYSSIDKICKKYRIKNYSINTDGTVDVDGDVNLSDKRLKKLPLKFNRVGGDFYCHYNELTTLEGAPKVVGGDFYCSYNQGLPWFWLGTLTTLEGSPKEVGGDFYCDNNQLTTLEGSPKEVGGDFICSSNPLPKEVLNFRDKKYILKWQDDYGIWQNGKLNQFRWQQMINDYDLG
jgi:hypothetical protein